jgi:hypothetical protein
MPFVPRAAVAHRSRRKFETGERPMMRVIDHLIERIEALFYPDRRPFRSKR